MLGILGNSSRSQKYLMTLKESFTIASLRILGISSRHHNNSIVYIIIVLRKILPRVVSSTCITHTIFAGSYSSVFIGFLPTTPKTYEFENSVKAN